MSRGTPNITLRLRPAEEAELRDLAKRAGFSLSDAFRYGARMFLEAKLVEPTKRGPKPKITREDGSAERQTTKGAQT
jgi:hypothetical protein